jgi:hypothetical protein
VTERGREPLSQCPLFPETPPAGSLPRRDCDVPDFAFLRSLRSHLFSSACCKNSCAGSAKRTVRSFAHRLRCFAHPPRVTGAPCATTVTMGGIDPEVATVTQSPFTLNLGVGPPHDRALALAAPAPGDRPGISVRGLSFRHSVSVGEPQVAQVADASGGEIQALKGGSTGPVATPPQPRSGSPVGAGTRAQEYLTIILGYDVRTASILHNSSLNIPRGDV